MAILCWSCYCMRNQEYLDMTCRVKLEALFLHVRWNYNQTTAYRRWKTHELITTPPTTRQLSLSVTTMPPHFLVLLRPPFSLSIFQFLSLFSTKGTISGEQGFWYLEHIRRELHSLRRRCRTTSGKYLHTCKGRMNGKLRLALSGECCYNFSCSLFKEPLNVQTTSADAKPCPVSPDTEKGLLTSTESSSTISEKG
jgi:hypothetical protein